MDLMSFNNGSKLTTNILISSLININSFESKSKLRKFALIKFYLREIICSTETTVIKKYPCVKLTTFML